MSDQKTLSKYLRKATGELQSAKARIRELEGREQEPIAIVGMSCRYPGGVTTAAELWDLVDEGRDAITPFPDDRGWDLGRLYDPEFTKPRTSSVRDGGFLHDAAEFDAAFFGISPREAQETDFQQRLLLECAWEAIEDAGITPAALERSKSGVYVGGMYQDYAGGAGSVALSLLSGRLSYAFGLEGPSLSVDTACSASLVAMHLAVKALRSGECELALAGGVCLMASPEAYIQISRQRGLAPDGRCKSFDVGADGTSFSEGAGLLVLERLADAEANGHQPLALIRGSAINQDGASNGFTAPNGPSQERVIRQALINSGLEPEDIDAIEAHGTGTPLGDPIEAQALIATYGQSRGERGPLALGSLKSNIGHTQAAAGVGSVIKIVMALQQEELPRTLHLSEPTPHVAWSEGEVELLAEPKAWPRNGVTRRAGVSSFGISGTNAHLILEEPPAPKQGEAANPQGENESGDGEVPGERPSLPAVPILVSAKAPEALQAQGERLAAHLRQNPELHPADLAHTLLHSRAQLEHRALVVGESAEEIEAGLAALGSGAEHPSLHKGRALKSPRAALLFPGQGSQWAGMGRELLESSEIVAQSIARCEEALAPFVEFSLTETLKGEEEEWLNSVEIVQPALFAVMVSLAELWSEHGVKPEAVLGHSQGEIAAAVVAGALSLEDGARVSALRAKAITEIAGKGGMVSLALCAEDAEELIAPQGESLSLAAFNGPTATVVSGTKEALKDLLSLCEEREIRAREIPVDYASHSPQVEAIEEQILADLEPISPRKASTVLYSSLTGEQIEGTEMNGSYWYRSLREPVRFLQATEALVNRANVLIESSPHPVLSLALSEAVAASEREAEVLHTLRREEGGASRVAAALGAAHLAGVAVDFAPLLAPTAPRTVSIPTYPFQRQRFWLEASSNGGDPSAFGLALAEHPLLSGSIQIASDSEHVFTGRLSLKEHPWLSDHALSGTALLPGVAMVELALEAGAELGASSLEELAIEAPILLGEDVELQLQVSVAAPEEEGRRRIEIHSRPTASAEDEAGEENPFTRNAAGWLSEEEIPLQPLGEWPPQGAEPIATEGVYEELSLQGFEYGPAFQGLEAAWKLGEEIYAEVALDSAQAEEAERYGVHPALLDSALHAVFLTEEAKGRLAVPFSFSGVAISSRGADSLRVTLSAPGKDELSLLASDSEGNPVCEIASLVTREIDPAQLRAAVGANADAGSLFSLGWQEQGLPKTGESGDEAAPVETFACTPDPELSPAQAARALCEQVLARLQEAIAAESGAEESADAADPNAPEPTARSGRVAFLTEGAVATDPSQSPDPAAAAVWGVVRSAQSEHPGRFLLIDTDGSETSEQALAEALAQDEESQLALRGGVALVPRLGAAQEGEAETEASPLDPEKTVLITGATGTLGATAARHLVQQGARHLLLLSRRGSEAPGAEALQAELEGLDATVAIRACDVSGRETLKEAIDSIDSAHPLGAIVHCAGLIDDALLGEQSPERLQAVFAPKADAAWHLHELSAEAELSDFILYSSLAGALGSPGQANYAAANTFLDALAEKRRAEGKPATSIAWGYWAEESEQTESMREADRARLGRGGLIPISTAEGMELLDRARVNPAAFVLATPIDRAALRTVVSAGLASPLLTGLVPASRRRGARGSVLAQRLLGAPSEEREALLLGVVREHVAAVLGHSGPEAIDPAANFKDLGFDSLGAVELRNRLAAATGLRLPATLVFDHPSCVAIASHVKEELEGAAPAKAAVRAATAGSTEPIAIVGMACRYPGEVSSPEQLWGLLSAGGDGIASCPTDRGWDLDAIYDPDPEASGKTYTLNGGFLADAAGFDASFFGISPREALAMDPHQRLLLECAWEALESAGIDPGDLRGTATGTFSGAMTSDYGSRSADVSEIENYVTTGLSGSIVSGRIAYALGLEGPAVTIDTACSSSMVATHLAAQALRTGECDMALAGGVSALGTPYGLVAFSRQRGLAPDGRCKSFDAAADGIGFAEGAGLLVLERLSDAERKGHTPLALIRGSATNQDGASNGLTAPNGPSQERVIRQALANAGVGPEDVDAVEAHGTGTTLGDPIEAQALLATYGQERGERGPLALGSLKSNIGHTQAAAGVGGVIKMVMALQQEELPKTLHLSEPTPHVAWSEGEVELLAEPKAWPRNGKVRRAGVSSFGISGTNAHLILEEPPAPKQAKAATPQGENESGDGEAPADRPNLPAVPILLSAKAPEALQAQGERLAAHLRQNPELHPADLAHTLLHSRAQLEHRALVVGESAEEISEGLAALGEGREHPTLSKSRALKSPRSALLFPGQGSQWAGMGRELLESSGTFAASIARCEEALSPFVEFSLTETLKGDDEEWLDRVEIVQPALFAVMVSLADLWCEHGLAPEAVLGHSQGEIAAAVAAGALSLEDGARVSALRAKAIVEIAGKGGMVSLALSAKDAEELIAPHNDDLSLAAFNGPTATVVSGAKEALQDLLALCEEREIRAREIPVDYASHSPQVEAIEEQILTDLEPISPRAATTPLFSSLTGDQIEGTELGASYWYRSLREPVRFLQATEALLSRANVLIESSPHPVLSLALSEAVAANHREAAVLHTLRRDEGGPSRVAAALGAAHLAGVSVDFAPLLAAAKPQTVSIPTYPFQRQRFWLEPSAAAGDLSAYGQSATEHPLLSAVISLANEGSHLFTTRLSLKDEPWLSDHAVGASVLLPATAFAELALRAGAEVGAEEISELLLEAPLLLPEDGAIQLQLTLNTDDEGESYRFEVHARPEPKAEPDEDEDAEPTPFTRHASGVLVAANESSDPFSPTEWPPPGAEPLATEELYERLEEVGLNYGPAFQGLEAAWRLGEDVYAEVSLAPGQADQAKRYGVHPALLDAALHAALLGFAEDQGTALRLPFGLSGVRLHGQGADSLWVRVRAEGKSISLAATDAEGQAVCEIDSLLTREVDSAQLGVSPSAAPETSLFTLTWEERSFGKVLPIELATEGEDSGPEAVPCSPDRALAPAEAARALCEQVLAKLQAATAVESGAEDSQAGAPEADAPDEAEAGTPATPARPTRLAFITEGAVATGSSQSPDPAAAAVWGLVRSAQSEHPGRFLLIDTDGSDASKQAFAQALTQDEEPQLALRNGVALVPRLGAADESEAETEVSPLDPEKTVLITGATGTLGAAAARHLVGEGARHLLLLSRRGLDAPGAAELQAQLEELGAEATIRACDVSERAALKDAIDSLGAVHPLGAVVHCAGAIDDALLAEQSPERLQAVFAAKADAAWHLHELSAEAELTDFVLYSSLAGALGNPGQANYAAANSFLDALAEKRRAEGKPATSIAWGYWAQESELTGELDEADKARLARIGFAPIATEEGLELLDRARANPAAFLAATPIDRAALRTLVTAGLASPLLAGLVPASRRRAAQGGVLARRLLATPEAEREAFLVGVVREHVAAVLGHSGPEEIDPVASFQDLGFDSLGAVELRNRLAAATGLRLPATLVFDYPTSAAVAGHLKNELEGATPARTIVRAATAGSNEPIAIVGMACRFPGEVSSPAGLWGLLDSGADAITTYPEDRGFDLAQYYDPDPEAAGKTYTLNGGYLADGAGFDAPFFSISPREAIAMDPQQRLFLECAWEAIEAAGIDPLSLHGSSTGIFGGIMASYYGSTSVEVEGYGGTGLSSSVASGRVAYALGLEGPAVSIDTACSSSLVAMHLAAQSLRSGESELALAGGATVMANPYGLIEFSRQRGLAPDGRCKSFDTSADGTGFAEGAGLLVLERLSDAEKNGHTPLALIRGSATNQDGASNGLTAPNGPSQERVIRQALANAGLSPEDVDAVEAHGTGTTLGDPIEAQALLATYGRERGDRGPLALGSLKSNIGHTQAAAGVGGVIKMVMALQQEELPKTLHLSEPTPHVAWSEGEVELLSEPKAWPRNGVTRRAGVSSFGASGTNAHLILEEPPAPKQAEPEGETPSERPDLPAVPILLSAKAPEALQAQGERLASHLRQNPELHPADLAHTLLHSRAQLEHRALVVGSDAKEIGEGLAALGEGREHPSLSKGRAVSQGKLAFVFSGQGSQWVGMGKELMTSSESFAARMRECEQALAPHIDFSVIETIEAAEGSASLDRIEVVQPVLFAMAVSLAELWSEHGIKPDAVLGHSQGEIAAAVVAGALSLSDGAMLAARRSQIIAKLAGHGAMVSLALPKAQAEELIEPFGDGIAIAALNSPGAVTLACGKEALPKFLAHCEEQNVRAREVPATIPSHSHFVEPLAEELASALADVSPQGTSQASFHSTVTAEKIEGSELDASYWYRNLREPVRFQETLESLIQSGFSTFIEIGSHPVLVSALSETVAAAAADPERLSVLHTLRRDEGGPARVAAALGAAHLAGVPVDFAPLLAAAKPQTVSIPTYAFQRQRFWLEPSAKSGDLSAYGQSATEHPLLGAAISLAREDSHLFTTRLSLKEEPWLADHAVGETVLLPATAYAELALRAGREVGAEEIAELLLEAPLLLPAEGALQLQLTLSSEDEGDTYRFEVHARPEPKAEEAEDEETIPFSRHASGVIATAGESAEEPFAPAEWPPAGAESLATEQLYERLEEVGLNYGPAFQGLENAWKLGDDVYAEVSLAVEEADQAKRYGVHPALLDAALQASLFFFEDESQMRLPFSLAGVRLHQGGAAALRVRVRTVEGSVSIAAADSEGDPVCEISSLITRELDASRFGIEASASKQSLFALSWQERSFGEALPAEPDAQPEDGQAEIFTCAPDPDLAPAAAARALCEEVLAKLQAAIVGESEEAKPKRLAFLTEGAVATDPSQSPDPAQAAVWGMVRSAQSEHPGRFLLLDTDGHEASEKALARALTQEEEPQLALRGGIALVPRLGAAGADAISLPEGPWRLAVGKNGTLEELRAEAHPEVERPLTGAEVRIEVRAAGINFRDALIAIGMYPGVGAIGAEGAGVVAEVGPEVEDLAPGDRVFGLFGDAFAPLAVSHRQYLAPIPAGWSFAQAASVPVVYCTAHRGLVELAELKAGERVLIHAGTGGVGMAAIQIAQHLGAEVFATASPAKWEHLRELGLDEDHIASSRDLEFEQKFLATTAGEGMDVVLDALAREFVDASLRLLPHGGRFLEMGKTDVRDPEQVAAEHPGVVYRAFGPGEGGPELIQANLLATLELFASGAVQHAPLRSFDVREARSAMRLLSQARHVGKLVLTLPAPTLDPEKTVLITGATGTLGAAAARHLVAQGARHLLLLSRRGSKAPGAAKLRAELKEQGAQVAIRACDVSERAQLKKAIGSIDPAHPLGAVVHCAGAIDDALLAEQSPERLEAVFPAKADAAWHLHELSSEAELTDFVLYSSLAGALGNPGQANYAAANTFLDALAGKRRAEGKPATSIAWGYWEEESELTGTLEEADKARLTRIGMLQIPTAEGLALLDRARAGAEPLVLATPIDRAALRTLQGAGALPPVFSGLFASGSRRRRAAASALAARIAATPEAEREALLVELVREHAAAVLGHSGSQAIDPATPFKDLGFDSLGAIELRNRLATATGLQLAPTLVFDHPNAVAIATHLKAELEGAAPAKARVRAASASSEPIAIVGMACRYPGGVGSPQELWRLLDAGGDGITRFPDDRGWDLDGIYDPDPAAVGKAYTLNGGYLEDADEFDAAFFGISPGEALAMDPQQRLLLECAWEALEEAGIDPHELRGSATGVYSGILGTFYGAQGAPPSAELEAYGATGIAASVASGRIAYTLGLEGPALSIDTACSSSLVATHLAMGALHSGECELALAGGVSMIASPHPLIGFSRLRALAPDGRCKSFAAGADGAGFSEGVGLLVLERLSDAEANGHRPLGLIRGSATNQDGASNGLAAPHGPSQERVIRQALANAGINPADVDAVEAHGTGTPLGDPIEAQALLATYGRERGDRGPLALGSLKSNIGHTQAAAGVGGVIKMVMALQEEELPKTLHLSEPTPHVQWEAGEVELLAEPKAWPRNGRVRRAGVSSFGISGTNAHLILEEPPAPKQVEGATPQGENESGDGKTPAERPSLPAVPILLSAKAPEALQAQGERLAAHLKSNPELHHADLAHTLIHSRAQLEHRALVVGESAEEIEAGLSALATGAEHPTLSKSRALKSPRAALLFPGQGSQWAGMGKELLESSETFAASIARCEEALAPFVEFPLTETLKGEDEEWLSRVEVVQPALFAVMVSLAELWSSYGLAPEAVLGHSQGEIAAAVVAGALSLEDGARVSALRAKAIVEIAGKGGMVSLALSAKDAEELIAPQGENLSLAAFNGPTATVVSGTKEALKDLLALCEEREIRAREIPVDYASHSPQVEQIEQQILTDLEPIAPRAATTALYSSLTGEQIEGTELDASYWYRSLREPVRFHQATEALLSRANALIESSPHPVLSLALSEAVAASEREAAVLHTLRREEGGASRVAAALGAAHLAGVEVDFKPLLAAAKPQTITIPTYAFQRQRFWLNPMAGGGDPSALGLSGTDHPLLGAAISLAEAGSHLFTARLSLREEAWLADHAVGDTALLPATAMVELALRAGEEVGATELAELILEAPLVLPAEGAVQLQLALAPAEGEDSEEPEAYRFELHARLEPGGEEDAEPAPFARHASGTLAVEVGESGDPFAPAQWPPAGAEPVASEDLYDRLEEAGLCYGPAFQGLEAAWRLGEDVYAEVSLASEQEDQAGRYGIHPALLDAALHAALLGLGEGDGEEALHLPFSIAGVRLAASGASRLRVRLRREGEGFALAGADEDGNPVCEIEALTVRALDPDRLGISIAASSQSLFAMSWQEQGFGAVEPGEAVAVAEPIVCRADHDLDPAAAARALCGQVLATLQAAVAVESAAEDSAADENGASPPEVPAQPARLAFLTSGAVAIDAAESPDPAQAAAWGLIRSAQSEHPGRFLLIDTDGSEASEQALAKALAQDEEPQVALRNGRVLVARLEAAGGDDITLPDGPWHLAPAENGLLDELRAVAAPEAERALQGEEVRIQVRAAGINFRDALTALAMYPGVAAIGAEGAGVVLEVGPEVTDLAPGDRVFGLFADAFGPLAVGHRQALAPIPAGWSFAEAAAIPAVHCTAHFGLVELGGLQAGERVLIHAGAGGVGMAAIQLAQSLGAEVFATASPGKWDALRALGLDEDHIASSRDLEFEQKFLAATDGEGMDVVLDSLAREFVDASLRLLPRGGRFLEMGKTDLRDPEQVAQEHPGVTYRAFDLLETGEQTQGMLRAIVERFESGAAQHSPLRSFDVREARTALRVLSQSRHTGKLVLTLPGPALDPEKTVLITGATGTLGAEAARHLIATHGVRQLLLLSRRGPEAPGAKELQAELEGLGAEATIRACDASDRAALKAAIDSIDAAHPLGAIVHCAGALDDALLAEQSPERLEAVFASKADAAWHLHELSAEADVSDFVLYSSLAGMLGNPGQANYAAANSFLDALAQQRVAEGKRATSIAWGYWAEESELTGTLDEADKARFDRAGMATISTAEGMDLFDRGRSRPEAALLAMPLEKSALRALDDAGALPPVFSGLLAGAARRRRAAVGALLARLKAAPQEEREAIMLALVREHIAVVLGHGGPEAVDPSANFKDLGFDSLGAVELRNRIAAATGLRLTPTLVFDYPTPNALAGYLLEQLAAPQAAPSADVLTALLGVAHEEGRMQEFLPQLNAMSQFRPRFDSLEQAGVELSSTRLASGPAPLTLACLPSVTPISGPHEYAHLARGFQEERDVFSVRWPGFTAIERLPATLPLAAELQAKAILEASGGAPFALLGHSTGGVLAYVTARHLEAAGNPPAAVVLIDSYPPAQLVGEPGESGGGAANVGLSVLDGIVGAAAAGAIGIDDVRLTAMAAYLQLVSEVEFEEIEAPLLLLRAAEPLDPSVSEGDWQPRWQLEHDMVEVPGNHMTMMNGHAESTAAAIAEWLTVTLGEEFATPADESDEANEATEVLS